MLFRLRFVFRWMWVVVSSRVEQEGMRGESKTGVSSVRMSAVEKEQGSHVPSISAIRLWRQSYQSVKGNYRASYFYATVGSAAAGTAARYSPPRTLATALRPAVTPPRPEKLGEQQV